MIEVINSLYPEMKASIEKTLVKKHMYAFNMMIMKRKIYDEYMEVLFSVMFKIEKKIECLKIALNSLKLKNHNISDVRQFGLISGIEISQEFGNIGSDVCYAARSYGLLTRSIGNTIVFMPPLSIEKQQIYDSLDAIDKAINVIVS